MSDLSPVQGRALWLLGETWSALPRDGVTRPTAQVLSTMGLVELADRRKHLVKVARSAVFVRLTKSGRVARQHRHRPR